MRRRAAVLPRLHRVLRRPPLGRLQAHAHAHSPRPRPRSTLHELRDGARLTLDLESLTVRSVHRDKTSVPIFGLRRTSA